MNFLASLRGVRRKPSNEAIQGKRDLFGLPRRNFISPRNDEKSIGVMTENQKKILIVDDSRGWIDYHKSALNEIYGDKFTLETAMSAREGYDCVYNNLKTPYDLIITDMQMEMEFEPKHAGEWFVEQVQKLNEYRNTPIIVVSASYNIRSIAKKLNVNCLPKAIAARDLTSYKLAIDEFLN